MWQRRFHDFNVHSAQADREVALHASESSEAPAAAGTGAVVVEQLSERGLRSDWLATEHVLQTHRGSKQSGIAATLCSQLQT